MEGKWGEAVNLCSQDPWLCRKTITRHGNTALHLAVSDCEEGVVRQLVGIIESRFDADDAVDVLSTRNQEGNTPLHLAVLVGKVEMCKCICDGRRPWLAGVRNGEGETPLFLAARIGEMDAFTCLLRRDTQNIYVNMRNYRGDTVLHSAISGEHFKLAFRILEKFPYLGYCVNEEGKTPLHILAEKPGAFRSGTYLSLFDRFICCCIGVIIWFAGDDGTEYLPPKQEESDSSDAPQDIIPIEGGRFSIPLNYDTCFNFISLVTMAVRPVVICVFSGLKGITWSKGQNYILRIRKKKERNLFSIRIMHQLVDCQTYLPYEYRDLPDVGTEEERELYGDIPSLGLYQRKPEEGASQYNDKGNETLEEGSNWAVVFKLLDKDGPRPDVVIVKGVDGDPADAVTKAQEAAAYLDDKLRGNKAQEKDRVGSSGQTPILLAAKNGITEMVERILETIPVAIHDEDVDKKNIVLLAAENRQPTVCELLLRRYGRESSLFRAVDKDGCSALHLAAKFSDQRPSFILGSALEMQQEVLWYEYVKASVPRDFLSRRNNKNEAANEIFMKDHKELMEKGKQWVKETATACSVVGTFIATMAYTASTTAPGGGNKEGGGSGNHSTLEQQEAAWTMFAVSSYITLSFSISSVVMFLATFISRNNVSDFARDLPVKLLLGLTCLFASILSMLVTSCAGPFFLPKDVIRIPGLVVFAVTSLPATYFAAAQLPLYIELIWATFRAVPRRWVEEAWW